MARNTRGSREFTELQELKQENKALKRRVSALRKELMRHEQAGQREPREERAAPSAAPVVPQARRCPACQEGTLSLCKIERRGGVSRWLRCDSCPKRFKEDSHGDAKDQEAVEGSERGEGEAAARA